MPASAWRFGAPVGQPAWVDVPPDVIDNEAVPTRRTNMDQKEEPGWLVTRPVREAIVRARERGRRMRKGLLRRFSRPTVGKSRARGVDDPAAYSTSAAAAASGSGA
jgi:hypothetical protein